MELFFMSALGIFPFLLLVFGFIPARKPKTIRQKMAPGAISFVLVLAISLALQHHYLNTYDFPIFPSEQDSRLNVFWPTLLDVVPPNYIIQLWQTRFFL
jgi:hypothetical protein